MFTRTAFFHTRVVVSVVLIDGTSSTPQTNPKELHA